ncbi:hypothetical protein ISS08_01080 [Candidatus Pacearchaeota archaeon]|nr:hypothetical protein [Candidatus Pacearchaeota archaeon]
METNYSLVVQYLNKIKKEGIHNGEKIGVLNSNGTTLPYPFKKGKAIVYKKGSIEGRVDISLPILEFQNSEKIVTAIHLSLSETYVQPMISK